MDHCRPDSFDARFADLSRLAHRVAFRLCGDQRDAEDIAQETMARAFVRWRRIDAYAEPWVARVATNLALGLLRRRRPSPFTFGERVDSFADDRLSLQRALRALPRRQREVVVLRFIADLPEAAVAERLGMRPGTVKQHLSRAMVALRPHFAIEGES